MSPICRTFSEAETHLRTLTADIRHHHTEAQRCAGEAVEHARQAGELLLQVKAGLEHGAWLPWLREQVEVSPRQAQRYMRVAENWDRLADASRVSHLSLRQVLDAIAEPRLTELQRAHALEAEADELRTELQALRIRVDAAQTLEECMAIRGRAAELERDATRIQATAIRDLGRLIREFEAAGIVDEAQP
jgi:hypothetical protein